jgi:hypothetical protein
MALTEKGKKLKKKFRGQYGKKKGDSIFYAMENSGKLKKVIKARGGMDASKDDFKTPSIGYTPGPGDTGDEGGGTKTNTVSGSGGSTINNIKNKIKSFTIEGPSVTLGLAKKFIFDPLTKGNRLRRAKGNMLIGGKKMPITRDYYRTTGKPLDVMSKEGVQYQKDAGLIKDFKAVPPTVGGGDSNTPQLCPDGSLPPCKPVTAEPTKANKPNFLSNFQAYNSGGVSSGPPPKRGPNPQVPPIKMKDGKMTKKYKMSCPHRPDGIRGVGAAIRGHKFIGVK